MEDNIFEGLSNDEIEIWKGISNAQYGQDIIAVKNTDKYNTFLKFEEKGILKRLNYGEDDEIFDYELKINYFQNKSRER